MLVASLVKETVTPGMTPLASRTNLLTPPVNCCAPATPAPANKRTRHTSVQARRLLLIDSSTGSDLCWAFISLFGRKGYRKDRKTAATREPDAYRPAIFRASSVSGRSG